VSESRARLRLRLRSSSLQLDHLGPSRTTPLDRFPIATSDSATGQPCLIRDDVRRSASHGVGASGGDHVVQVGIMIRI
jgi:hypothetical protein